MNPQRLIDTARSLVAGDRGLRATDGSTPLALRGSRLSRRTDCNRAARRGDYAAPTRRLNWPRTSP